MALPDSLNTVTVRKLANTLNSYNTKVNTKLDGKADKVAQATSGHLASLDGNGNLQDSGFTTASFATAAQGAKADTAIQGVKLAGQTNPLTPDSNKIVTVPNAVATGTGETNGLMTAADKAKLNGIATGAEVNQNAFSNVQVGTGSGATTIAATTKTDTLTLESSGHVTLTPSAAAQDKKVTIGLNLSSLTELQNSDEESLVTRGEKYTWNAKQNALPIDGTPSSSNKVATQNTITTAIGNLDVASVGGNGKYISAISESDGKISATATTMDTTPTSGSTKAVTSGGIKTELDKKAPIASPAFTGTPTAPTAAQGTSTTQIATTEFVVTEIDTRIEELGDAMVYQGTLAGSTGTAYGTLTPQANKGWTYKVTTAGKIDGVAVEVGDMLICNADNTPAATASDYATVVAKWDFIQTNLDGAVIGPSSAVTNSSVAGFDGTTGKKIKQLSASEIKSAAGLSNVANTNITVSATGGVTDNTNNVTYKYTHYTTTQANAAPVKVGRTAEGHVIIGSALDKSDVGLGNVENTGDSAIPVENGTDKFTTGGAYTELAKKVDKETGKGLSSNDYTDAEKTKLGGIAANAEVNQNAFSNIKVGSTTVAADAKTDTVELVGSQHVTITPDATTNTITIATDIQNQTAYTSKGSATKVPQITTNSLGQVTSITEVTISGVTPASHTHGNITNGGALQTTDVAIANGDKLVITDADNSNKVARSSTAFDGSTTTTALTPKGTFESFAKAADITSAIQALDSTKTSTDGTNVQVKVTETDGKITAVNITTDNTENKNNKVTAWSSTTTDTNYPSEKLVKDSLDGKASSSHSHGNITNGGAITATGVALASGDSLVFVDSSDSSKIKKTSITFDGSTATKALTQKGTWETFNNYTHPTYDTASAAAVKVGRDSTGHVVIGDALTKSDVGLGNVANTQITVSATDGVKDVTNNVTYKYTHPTSAGNKHIPSGGSAGQVLVYGGSSGTASWATLTDASMGQGYSATTSWSSAACTVTMDNYELKTGGIVAIKFAAAVPANATLNINGKGAKNIKYRGSNITSGIIQAGDIAYFMYDGTNYTLLGTDRSVGEMTDTEVTDLLAALT